MTQTSTRALKRETPAVFRGRSIVVELHAAHVELRLKGCRYRYTISYRGVFEAAAKAEALRARAEKLARKGKKR